MKTSHPLLLVLAVAASGCVGQAKETPFLRVGADKLSVNSGGIAYYDANGKVRLEFFDLDKDGSAEYLRVYSAIDSQGCEVMTEDYEADGIPEMRMTSCRPEGLGGPSTSRLELSVGNQWLR